MDNMNNNSMSMDKKRGDKDKSRIELIAGILALTLVAIPVATASPTISITPKGDPYFTNAGAFTTVRWFNINFDGSKDGLTPYIDVFDVKGKWGYGDSYNPVAPDRLMGNIVTVILYDESGKTVAKAKFSVSMKRDYDNRYVETKFVEGDSRITLTFDNALGCGWDWAYNTPSGRAYAQDFEITAKYEKGIDHLIVKRSSGKYTWVRVPGTGDAYSKVIDCKGRTMCTTTVTLLTKEDRGSAGITVVLVGTDGKHYTASKTIHTDRYNQIHKPRGTLTITGTGITTKTYEFTYGNLPKPYITLYAKKNDPTFGKVASATVKIVTYSDDGGYYQYSLVIPDKYSDKQKKEIKRNIDDVTVYTYCPKRSHLVTSCKELRLNKLPPGSYILSITFKEDDCCGAISPAYSYSFQITLNVLDYVNPKDVTVKITLDKPPLLARETSATITITKPNGHVSLSIYKGSKHLADLTCTSEKCEHTIKIPVDGLPNVAGAKMTIPLTIYVNGEEITKNVEVTRGEGFEPNTEITLSYLVTKEHAGPLKTIKLDYDGKQYNPISVSRSLKLKGTATGTVTFKIRTSDKTSIAYMTTCDDNSVCDSKPLIIPIHLSTVKPQVCSIDLSVTTNVKGCLKEGETGYVTVTASTNGNCKIKRLDVILTNTKGEKSTSYKTYNPPRQYVTYTTSFSPFSGTITITATTDTGLKKSHVIPIAVCSIPTPTPTPTVTLPPPKPTPKPTTTTPTPTPTPTTTPTITPTPTPTPTTPTPTPTSTSPSAHKELPKTLPVYSRTYIEWEGLNPVEKASYYVLINGHYYKFLTYRAPIENLANPVWEKHLVKEDRSDLVKTGYVVIDKNAPNYRAIYVCTMNCFKLTDVPENLAEEMRHLAGY